MVQITPEKLFVYFTFLILLLGASPGVALSDSSFTFGKDNMNCGMSLPTLKKGKEAGLIIWFHGGMRTMNNKKGVLGYKAIHPFINPDEYFVLSPAVWRERDWLNHGVTMDVNKIAGELIQKFSIDSTNINLVGVSDGCVGVIKLSLHTHLPIRNRLMFSSAPQLVIGELELKRQAIIIKNGWHFFQGVKDRLFAADRVIPFLYYWKKTVPGTTLHIYQEGEHNFGWYAKNAKKEIVGILKRE